MTEKPLDPADFWQGPFGEEYSRRNESSELLRANQRFFELSLLPARYLKALRVIEFGANIGMNIKALKQMEAFQLASFTAVEINKLACERLRTELPDITVVRADMTDPARPWMGGYDLVLCKGVLIHVPEDRLPAALTTLYEASSRFIFLAEYHAVERRMVTYRGHADKLWLDDYGSKLWDQYPDLKYVDTGFAWRRDPIAPQDSLVWWMFEKPTS